MTTRLESLDHIYQACWQELGKAPRNKAHGFRVMGLATVDGEVADLRSVVLREVLADAQTLVFFTDARSPKVAQIQRQPAGTLLAWCERLSWQLRLRVQLEVETSGLAVSSRWARLKMTPAAQDYLSPLPPGAPVEPLQPERSTRNHFAVLLARVYSIDWLELHAEGHRRAIFDQRGHGRWLTP
ncbi:MAG: pyridoxamine 5'-phosphate oxidase family protein [Microbacteriaceae bacterium]|nr:pyridoxamine 5'-phosphate oxidase family protein [Burkholderiaceae bacterium]